MRVWPLRLQVREFDIVDACPYTLELEWDKDGTMTRQPIFERLSAYPNSKMLTLLRNKVGVMASPAFCPGRLRCTCLRGHSVWLGLQMLWAL